MKEYTKKEKEKFINEMQSRTKQFAIDTIKYCDELPKRISFRTIIFQLVKSSTSVGANYRAACRARSKAEFFSKMSITVEEADETQYWLEIIKGLNVKSKDRELERLLSEIEVIIKVFAKARKNAS